MRIDSGGAGVVAAKPLRKLWFQSRREKLTAWTSGGEDRNRIRVVTEVT